MMEHKPRNRRHLKRPQARLEGTNHISIFTIIIFISISSYVILHLGFAVTFYAYRECDDTTYDPASSKYHPVNSACWKDKQKCVLFSTNL